MNANTQPAPPPPTPTPHVPLQGRGGWGAAHGPPLAHART